VNIVYVEPGSEAPQQVKDMVQQQKFLVLPKGMIDTEKPIMRVIRASKQQQLKKGKKQIYFVGVPTL
jgi:glycerol-3-phosphate responsive antiterminator